MSDETAQAPVLQTYNCLYAGLSQALRAAQVNYVTALRPHNLTPAQFTVLSRLAGMGECQLSALATVMGLDRTTLTRNLGPLIRRDLVSNRTSQDDRRVRLLDLTDAGRAAQREALTSWRDAQRGMVEALGPDLVTTLLSKLKIISRLQPAEA